MIARTQDAEQINRLANDPSIRPFVGGDGESELDLSDAVADEQNVFLAGDHGAFAFTWSAPGIYEVHTLVLPSGRGRWAFVAARAVLAEMAKRGASMIWTRVLPEASHVRAFTLRAGFKRVGSHRVDLGIGPTIFDTFEWRP